MHYKLYEYEIKQDDNPHYTISALKDENGRVLTFVDNDDIEIPANAEPTCEFESKYDL